jgi:hypothetical protein
MLKPRKMLKFWMSLLAEASALGKDLGTAENAFTLWINTQKPVLCGNSTTLNEIMQLARQHVGVVKNLVILSADPKNGLRWVDDAIEKSPLQVLAAVSETGATSPVLRLRFARI